MAVNRIGGGMFDAGSTQGPKGTSGDPDAFFDLLNEQMQSEDEVNLGESVSSISSIGSVNSSFTVTPVGSDPSTYLSKSQVLEVNDRINPEFLEFDKSI
jgi:hypothetical protein